MLSALFAIAMALVAPSAAAAMPAPQVGAATAEPLATPQFRRYGLADGLPGSMIYAVVQDRDGYMWFATTGGLARYDGVGFKVLRHDANDPASLPDNQIYTLFVDRQNRLWVGEVASGLACYDPVTGTFRQWRHDDADPSSLSHDEVWSITQTPDGQIWVATQDGLDRMRPDDRGFDHVVNDAPGEPPARPTDRGMGSTRALLAEPGGRLWIGTDHGIYLRQRDGRLQRVPVEPGFDGDLSKVWRIEGGGDDVRVATSHGLFRIGRDGVLRGVEGKLGSIRSMSSARDARGRLWVGTENGVWLVDGSDTRVFAGHPLLPGGFPAEAVWDITRDREGGLWFAAADAGVAYLPPGWDGFTRITHIPDDPYSLSTTAAETVQVSRDNQLWVGGVGAVDKLDPATGHVQHVAAHLRESVVSLAEDRQGRLWMAGQGALYVRDAGKLQRIDTHGQAPSRPTRLVAASDGLIYVASWGEGLYAIDPDSRRISPVPLEQDQGDALTVSTLLRCGGMPWYASAAGLMRWDAATRGMVFVKGVPRRFMLGVACSARGFWTAWENGLEHYRYASGRAVLDRTVKVPADWQSRDILGLREDRQGRLWIFANQGLWRLDPASGQFQSFGPQDGLLDGAFNNDHTTMLANGMIYGATKGGVIGFSPERLAAKKPPTVAPEVVISGVSINRDGVVHAVPLDRSAPLRLGWRDRDLRVEARVASYIDPGANRYRFRLRGFDPDWVDTGNRGEREFAGLEAGNYLLEVMAAGAGDDVWSAVEPVLVHVQSPPWARWWAWLIYAVCLVLSVWLLLGLWRRRLAQRQRIQLAEQASAAKTQFLAMLSHEIRTPMTGVMGMAELLLTTPLGTEQREYTQAMQRSGSMLLKLLNDALDLARIEAGRLELEPAPFDPRQLVDDVARLEFGQAQAKGLHFAVELADDLPPRVIGDAVRIKQILLNLANNALKFTEAGSVTLRAERDDGGLLFSVRDTGPGIAEASQVRLFQRFEQVDGPQRRAGSGLGLAICRELVGIMGGSIELESRLAHGSTFRVRLPLQVPVGVPATVVGRPEPRPRGSWRVLLVEDDAIVAAVICGLLERQGHRVCHVANGLAALAELAQQGFDAILLDLDLPGVDGFQVARLIRQRGLVGARVPLIAITARSGGDEEMRTRAAGMDHFLRKPFTGEQLGALLDDVVPSAAAAADPA
jgi:signal transduction histidine kinase/ligand-binding sensor domain-containing protein/CheY-like chemotaxis protein